MNPSQEKYLKTRLEQIIKDKTCDLVWHLTAEERDAEFAAGRYEIVRDSYGGYIVIFPREKELRKNCEEAKKKLADEKYKILDQVMLGGQTDLEKMFEDFKALKV